MVEGVVEGVMEEEEHEEVVVPPPRRRMSTRASLGRASLGQPEVTINLLADDSNPVDTWGRGEGPVPRPGREGRGGS